MTTLTEGRYAAEFVMYEEEGQFSRDNAVIASGAGVVKPGALLAKLLGGTVTQAAKAGGNTGNGTLAFDGSTPVLAGAKAGVYTVRFTAATAFTVEDPDGNVIGTGATGAAFSDDVKFTITAGGTAFVAGDGFDLTVDITGSKFTVATDSLVAEAIALYGCDATSADQKIPVIARLATVNGNLLVYDATVNTATKKAIKNGQLARAGIIVR